VATMIRSMSLASRWALASARLAAIRTISEVACSGATMCRSFIPVRETIHSSVVSTIFSRSAFVRILSGA